ncbi:MAG: OmpA family protein [Spirochaetes bacterium]|nr:OmpA family protein [Spirochaetota bacterium]
MKKLLVYVGLSFAGLYISPIIGKVLDRKTVVVAPRKIERGKKLAHSTPTVEIYFAEGSARLNRASRRTLRSLAIPRGARVQVMGHANVSGDKPYNKRLSRQRALAVVAYLKARQPRATYRYKSFGKTHPAYSNKSRSGYRMNRRVVVRVLGV